MDSKPLNAFYTFRIGARYIVIDEEDASAVGVPESAVEVAIPLPAPASESWLVRRPAEASASRGVLLPARPHTRCAPAQSSAGADAPQPLAHSNLAKPLATASIHLFRPAPVICRVERPLDAWPESTGRGRPPRLVAVPSCKRNSYSVASSSSNGLLPSGCRTPRNARHPAIALPAAGAPDPRSCSGAEEPALAARSVDRLWPPARRDRLSLYAAPRRSTARCSVIA